MSLISKTVCICICERIPTHKYLYYGHWFAQHLLLKLFLSYHDDVEETNVRYILNCISSFPSSKGIKKQKRVRSRLCQEKNLCRIFAIRNTSFFLKWCSAHQTATKPKIAPILPPLCLLFIIFATQIVYQNACITIYYRMNQK